MYELSDIVINNGNVSGRLILPPRIPNVLVNRTLIKISIIVFPLIRVIASTSTNAYYTHVKNVVPPTFYYQLFVYSHIFSYN